MIRLENLSKSFADKVILRNVTYHFPEKERIALIGANGQGKTTLLNIITGQDDSESGMVVKPKSMRLAFLPQSPNPSPEMTIRQECMAGHKELYEIQMKMDAVLKRMAEDYIEADYHVYEELLKQFETGSGYQLEGRAEKILLGLGFREEQLDQHPSTLSGGWRMRLELAKVLVAKPDFLILDEPTNHLDLPSIEWLENYLHSFNGTLLFVSHDRAFLNNLSTITAYLCGGNMQAYAGNFDSFMEQREQAKLTQAATLKKIVQKQEHMQSFVDRFKAKASKAKQANSRVKMIERLQTVINGMPAEVEQGTIHIPRLTYPPSGKDVFSLKKINVGYNQPLIRDLTLNVQRGQKLAIVGANGMGKSTLLKTIAGSLPVLAGEVVVGHNVKVGFYTQDAADKLDKQQTVLTVLKEANPDLSEQMCRALLGAFLFRGNDLAKYVCVLSGGERSRLALCCLLAQQPNVLLLDEPTNHLDLASTQVLAEMLEQYPGTVLFVSHDRDFVEQIASTIVEIGSNGKAQII